MQKLLFKKTTLNFTFVQNKYVGVYLWLAPFRPSPAARKALLPAAQSVLSLWAIFGSWVHLSSVILPTPALVRRTQTLPCTPSSSLPLPSARCRCRLRPPSLGSPDTFSLVLLIFPGRRLAIQSFMWEASCWHPEYMSQICPASLSDPSAPELRVSNLLMGDGVPASSAWNSL